MLRCKMHITGVRIKFKHPAGCHLCMLLMLADYNRERRVNRNIITNLYKILQTFNAAWWTKAFYPENTCSERDRTFYDAITVDNPNTKW